MDNIWRNMWKNFIIASNAKVYPYNHLPKEFKTLSQIYALVFVIQEAEALKSVGIPVLDVSMATEVQDDEKWEMHTSEKLFNWAEDVDESASFNSAKFSYITP